MRTLGFRFRGRLWLIVVTSLLFFHLPSVASELTIKDGKLFCRSYGCDEILPQADTFKQSELTSLPVIEAYRQGELVGYVFLSTDLVDIPAYSGRPMVTLIAIDPAGVILDAKVVHHSEPILLVGIPESVLNEFLAQYVGHKISEIFEISSGGWLSRGVRRSEGGGRFQHASATETDVVPIDMITGATVTAQVMDQTLVTSARTVAETLGIVSSREQRIVTWMANYVPKSWDELVAEGSVGHLSVSAREFDENASPEKAWIDLYFGDLSQPLVGINILGEAGYQWLEANLKPGEKAIFVSANGIDTFKGSGFVRGGIFERFYLLQGYRKFTFRDLDYEHLYGIKAAGAPKFKETGLFILRSEQFDSSLPWSFFYVGSRLTGETARSKVFKTFSSNYQFPAMYFDIQVVTNDRTPSMVSKIWRNRIPEVITLVAFLASVVALFLGRGWLTRSRKRLDTVHVAVLILSVVLIGLLLKSPPSIAHLYPLARAFIDGFSWDLYLSDPIQFIFWIFIAVSLLVWGRGWFCGWICPYGAMLELTHRVSKILLPKKWIYQLPMPVHNVLRRLRYVIFFALILTALYSIEMAERLTEVEPFKSTWIIGIFNREWIYIAYWLVIFVISIFIYRFYCRYLCPLGAAFSIGSVFQLKRIRRRDFCTRCNVCATQCDSLSINKKGEINRYECYSCFECEQTYADLNKCPPVVFVRKNRKVDITESDRKEIFQLLEKSKS